MVFSKIHTKVYANDKNQVASNSAGPWAKTSVCSDKLAQGEYDICNEIKGVLKERVHVKIGQRVCPDTPPWIGYPLCT